MGNRYFRLLKNIKLWGENKNIKKRNEGASLVYVLVILSIISAFSINFAYYVRQKKEMVFLKSQKENNVEKKFLIQKENQNVERILNKGILFDGNTVLLDRRERYFDSILKKNGQTIEIKNLIFLAKDAENLRKFGSRVEVGKFREARFEKVGELLIIKLNSNRNDSVRAVRI